MNRVRKSLSLALAACTLAALVAPAAQADPDPFSPASFWNTPLAPTSPTDVNSAQYMSNFAAWMKANEARSRYQYIASTTMCGSPVYTVPAGTPTVNVKAHYPRSPGLQDQMNNVPIPAGAVASQNCTDEYMTIYRPSTDEMWDFWKMEKQPGGGWGAYWAGHMTNVSSNPGHFDSHWGVTATSLPLLGGLIRLSDLAQGHIDHALAFAIPYPRKNVYSWPAQRTDGRGDGQWDLPEGARLRLDPTVDVASLNLTPFGRMVAEAMQRYGMVLRDRTQDALLVYGEQPQPGQANPYPTYFGGQPAWAQLRAIPWDRMQLMPLSNSDCSLLQAPVGLPVNSVCGMPYSLTDQSPQGGSTAPGSGGSGSTGSGSGSSSAGSGSKQSGGAAGSSQRSETTIKLGCTVHRVRIVYVARRHHRLRRVVVWVNGHRRHGGVTLSHSRRSMSLRLARSPGKKMTVTVRVWVRGEHHVSQRTIRRVYPACG